MKCNFLNISRYNSTNERFKIFNKKRVNLKVSKRKIDKTIHEQKRYEIYSKKNLTGWTMEWRNRFHRGRNFCKHLECREKTRFGFSIAAYGRSRDVLDVRGIIHWPFIRAVLLHPLNPTWGRRWSLSSFSFSLGSE